MSSLHYITFIAAWVHSGWLAMHRLKNCIKQLELISELHNKLAADTFCGMQLPFWGFCLFAARFVPNQKVIFKFIAFCEERAWMGLVLGCQRILLVSHWISYAFPCIAWTGRCIGNMGMCELLELALICIWWPGPVVAATLGGNESAFPRTWLARFECSAMSEGDTCGAIM